jgi:hypothetical protein
VRDAAGEFGLTPEIGSSTCKFDGRNMGYTQASHRLHAGFTRASRGLHTGFTQASHRLHAGPTQAPRRSHASFTQTSRGHPGRVSQVRPIIGPTFGVRREISYARTPPEQATSICRAVLLWIGASVRFPTPRVSVPWQDQLPCIYYDLSRGLKWRNEEGNVVIDIR